MSVDVGSRYFGEPKRVDLGGKRFVDRRKPTVVPQQPDDIPLTVREGETLNHLAFRAWGDSQLFWLIADANDLQDPTIDLIPGTKLRAPARPDEFLR